MNDMKPVACDLSLTFGNMCQCKNLDLFTADQLRAAKVAVLRDAGMEYGENTRFPGPCFDMADELENEK